MTAYRDMPDTELERKVLELMGYELREHPTYKNRYQVFLNGEGVHDWWWKDPKDAWCFAPNPITDMVTHIDLIEEIEQAGHPVADLLDTDGIPKGRAICEVYCMVKEGQK